jgi:hypothetical protein
MRKIFAASALGLVLFTGACATVDAGVIKDKVRESGGMEYDCDTKGTGKNKRKVCGFETLPDKCIFYLDNGTDRGWSVVRCEDEYNDYQIGERYPR